MKNWILYALALSFSEVGAFEVHFDLPEGQKECDNKM